MPCCNQVVFEIGLSRGGTSITVYLIRRFLLALLTIWVISVLSFVVIQLPPGDSVDAHLKWLEEIGFTLSADHENDLRAYYGIDEPIHLRYIQWFGRLLKGDPGRGFFGSNLGHSEDSPVIEVVGDRIWTTIALAGFTIAFTWTFAIPIGIYSAVRQHSIGDYVFTFLGFTGLAVPDFLLGLVLLYIALAYFDQSVGGLFSTEQLTQPWSMAKIWDLIKHLWIPAAVLGTSGTASLIRIMRNNLLDELGKPYVVTARAKGMSPWRVIIKYPVRVAINPLVSTVGYLLPYLIGGSVIVSVVLGLPTLGPVLLQAIKSQDTPSGAFIMLMLGMLTVIGTFISDILLAVVDPRIKFGEQ